MGRKRFNKQKETSQLSKKQRNDIKELGELHPADIKDDAKNVKYTKILEPDENDENIMENGDSSDEEEDRKERENPYQLLINSLAGSGKTVSSSKYESSDDDSEEEKVCDDNLTHADTDKSDDEIDDDDDIDNVEQIDNEKDGNDDNEDDKDEDDDDEEEDDIDEENQDNGILINKEEKNINSKTSDPFKLHFENMISEELSANLESKPNYKITEHSISEIGKYQYHQVEEYNKTDKPPIHKQKDLKLLSLKDQLCLQVAHVNKNLEINLGESENITSLQANLLSSMCAYQDILYPNQSYLNKEEIRVSYCLHILNHCMKTRSQVVHHNTKMKTNAQLEYRDQGYARPKVLILAPFRDSVFRIVNILIEFLKITDQSMVMNRKRFIEEFEEKSPESTGKKPDDFTHIFSGNIDDHFRIGLSIAKKTLKLYTEFYSSDVIIASPLGLRTVIGADGEEERDYDFLSSIEILIIDQADIFMMQNWEHVLHIMKHLHLQPQEPRNIDFSRIRMWTLNGWSRFYRQTCIFSSISPPEMNSLISKHCFNYAGKIIIPKLYTDGSIAQIVTTLPQVFKRVNVLKFSEASDARFKYFKDEIIPDYMDEIKSRTLIFVSSYFDFVRIRNYMKKEEIDFFSVNEYTKESHISKARSMFYHNKTHFLVYTERVHFYRRFIMKGIRHIIFYQLPLYGKFYEEICNALTFQRSKDNSENIFTCTILYTRYDAQRLSAVVGTNRAAQMINSEKDTHMLLTGTS